MTRKKRYDSLATLVYRWLIDPLIHPLRPRIVRLCGNLEVNNVLDIASGTGAQCRALGRAGLMATGLDLSEEMIAHARRRGGRHVHYIRGSALDLPFADDSFDVCTLVLALHEHPEAERTRMLAEAMRVASRYLIIADYERPRRPWLNPPWQLIRLIEASAGSGHHTGFRDFAARRGLAGLAARHQLTAGGILHSHFGTIALTAFPIPKPSR